MADEPKENMMESAGISEANGTGQKHPMKWYVVQVYSGFEQKVKLSLAERIKQAGMDPAFGEVLIPTETVQDNQGAKRVSSKTAFTPATSSSRWR